MKLEKAWRYHRQRIFREDPTVRSTKEKADEHGHRELRCICTAEPSPGSGGTGGGGSKLHTIDIQYTQSSTAKEQITPRKVDYREEVPFLKRKRTSGQ